MNEIHLKNWSEFPKAIQKIQKKYAQVFIGNIPHSNYIYFRGQANSDWALQTTLERTTNEEWSIRSYEQLALRLAPEIETLTDKNWGLPKVWHIDKIFEENKSKAIPYIPFKEFWIYLRHHGLPSPLLDWTLSPYIAAFFAFCNQSDYKSVAIFAYIETTNRIKGGWVGGPQITVIGKNFKTHKRHFLQQGCYTICSKYREASEFILDDHIFCPHESVFEDEHFSNSMGQDILYRITLPASERASVLEYLNQFNINDFSLTQTEDALMKTLSFREIEINGPR